MCIECVERDIKQEVKDARERRANARTDSTYDKADGEVKAYNKVLMIIKRKGEW